MSRPVLRPLTIVAALILLSWVASLAWLAARHLTAPTTAALADRAALQIAPSDAWFAVMVGPTQVGTASVTLDTLSPGFRITESVALTIPTGDTVVHSARVTQMTLSPTLLMQDLTGSWSLPGSRLGVTSERVRDSVMLTAAPGNLRGSLGPMLGLSGLHVAPYQMALAEGLRAGRVARFTLLDAWPTQVHSGRLQLGADSVVVFPDSTASDPVTGAWSVVTTRSVTTRLMTVDGGTGPLQVLVDQRGTIQGLETLFGVRWVRQDLDLAQTAFLQTRNAQAHQIRSAYPTIRTLGTARPEGTAGSGSPQRILLGHRDGTPLRASLAALLTDGRQTVVGDTLVVTTGLVMLQADEPTTIDPLLSLPRSWPDGNEPEVPGLPSEAPDTVAALLAWVDRHLTIDTTDDAPQSVLALLNTGRGHPDAVARLFVVLARQMGLEARVVTGILPAGDILYTHAWVELRTADGWRSIDPVRGDAVASPALVRLGRGGFSAPWAMWSHLANARLTLLPSPMSPP